MLMTLHHFRLCRGVFSKAVGLEERDGGYRPKSKHEEDKVHGVWSRHGCAERFWQVPLRNMQEMMPFQLHCLFSVKLWVHKKCGDIKGRLIADPGYVCRRCRCEARPIDGRPITSVSVDRTLLDVVPTFRYLGDMLSAGGGWDLAINVKCQTAWSKFRRFLPLPTSRHVSLKIRGKLYSACVSSAMLYSSETRAITKTSLQWLERNDGDMIRRICVMQGTHTNDLRGTMGLVDLCQA